MKYTPLIAICLFSSQAMAAQGAMTIAGLPNAAEMDHPVCYKTATGELGNCMDAGNSSPARITWVSNDNGGDYADPNAALADIASWCPSPTADSPCLMRIAPGSYDMGSSRINMLPYVHIQGSGSSSRNNGIDVTGVVTQIRGAVPGTSTALVVAAQDTSISDVSIINTLVSGSAVAIRVVSSNNFRIDNVHAYGSTSTGSTSNGLRVYSSNDTPIKVYALDSNFAAIGGTGGARGVFIYALAANSNTTLELDRCTTSALLGATNYSVLINASPSTSEATLNASHSTFKQLISIIGSGVPSVNIDFTKYISLVRTAAFGNDTCQLSIDENGASLSACDYTAL